MLNIPLQLNLLDNFYYAHKILTYYENTNGENEFTKKYFFRKGIIFQLDTSIYNIHV